MISMTLEMNEKLEAFRELKVMHPRLEEMGDALKRAIRGHRSYTLLALYGATGVGKSTIMNRIARECREEESDLSVVPVVIVKASPEDIGASARLDYYRQILAQLQWHVAVKDRVMNLSLFKPGKKSHDPAEWLDMRDAVEYALKLLRVKVVFVDEAQHLMYVDTPHKPTAQLDWLKSLTNRTNVLHVLVGNFDLYDFCHLNAQAARRMLDQPFSRYHLDNKTECEEFVGALRSLLEQVPLTVDVQGLLLHWRWFGEWSLGCIGVLSDWIVETVDTLYKAGETTLTVEALKKYALQPDQRVRMEMEARKGEYKVERAKAESEQELKRLLGNPITPPGSADKDVQSATGIERETISPETTKSTGGKTRVERGAIRDLVGDQVKTAKTLKCTFPGDVSIEAKRFLESGIRLVECPNCLRTRSLSPHNGVIRFPSHEKRKTRTPNTDQRWAMVETAWGVVGG